MVMAAKMAHLYIGDLLVGMRSRRPPSLSSSIITCVKQLSLMYSRNVLGCLLAALLSCQQILGWLSDTQSWGFWMSKENFIYFVFLIRQSVAHVYHNITCVGLSFDLCPQALHWFVTSPKTLSTQNTPLCRA